MPSISGLSRTLSDCNKSGSTFAPAGNQERDYFTLAAMVPGWWVAPAVDRPSQRRGFVLSVLEVQICSWNQPPCQLVLTEQRRPMERGLPEAPAQFRSRSGIQQPQPYFLRSEARGPDQRRVLPFLLKIEVRPGLDQHFDEPQFLAFWQHAVEEHVRNVVEWMGSSAPILPPTDQLIGRTGASASMRRKAVA